MKLKAGYCSEPMRVRMSYGTQAAIRLSIVWLHDFPSLLVCVYLLLSVCLSVRLLPCSIWHGASWLLLHCVTFWIQNPDSTHQVLPHSNPSSLIPE